MIPPHRHHFIENVFALQDCFLLIVATNTTIAIIRRFIDFSVNNCFESNLFIYWDLDIVSGNHQNCEQMIAFATEHLSNGERIALPPKLPIGTESLV